MLIAFKTILIYEVQTNAKLGSSKAIVSSVVYTTVVLVSDDSICFRYRNLFVCVTT